jgi:hypothetical protein
MLALRWRPAPRLLILRWRGPDLSPAALRQPAAPGAVAVVIGPPGPRGVAGGAPLVGVAVAAVGGHRAVATLGDGTFRAVGPGDPLAEHVVGLTLGAAAAGGDVEVQAAGPMTHAGWTWTPGPIWLGAGGEPTQALPSAGAIVRLGEAITPTTILINPRLVARTSET